jgi:hypothetical protein
MKTKCMLACMLATVILLPVMAQDGSTTNMEILRQKVKADKKLLVAMNLNLTDAEGAKFWPVYDAYQVDLQQINQRMSKAILAYADAYDKGTVSDVTAKKLLDEAVAIDVAEANLKSALVPKILAVLPATKAARYFQIENKIRAALRYELAEGIPLVQ